jgi:hypothetical protein
MCRGTLCTTRYIGGPGNDAFDHLGFRLGVVIHARPASARQITFRSGVEFAIFGVFSEVVAQQQVAPDFGRACGEDVHVHVLLRCSEHAVLVKVRLAHAQDVAWPPPKRVRKRLRSPSLRPREGCPLWALRPIRAPKSNRYARYARRRRLAPIGSWLLLGGNVWAKRIVVHDNDARRLELSDEEFSDALFDRVVRHVASEPSSDLEHKLKVSF